MTLDAKEKTTLSDIRMAKARECLDDASSNLTQGRLRTAVNRAYYAALNASRALLILEGYNPETHDGTVTLLSLHFVKTGLLPVETIKAYKKLLSVRSDIDYGDFDSIDRAEAEESLQQSKTIVSAVDALRKKLASEL